jgi:hypothetical protein
MTSFLRHKIGKDFKRLENDWFNGTGIRFGSRLYKIQVLL